MRVNDIVALPADTQTAAGHSLGAVLIEAGKLRPEQVDKILKLQREKGLRFGEAAIALRLVSREDIEYAVSRQFGFAYLLPRESRVSAEVVTAYEPFSPQAEAIRAVRAQLMLRWLDNQPERNALAIISASRSEGRSYIAANLAVVFSQLGERTLLIDGDLRLPRQHQLFGLDNRVGLSSVLAGRAGAEVIQKVPGLARLSVLPAGVKPPNPQELLAGSAFAQVLAQARQHYDVVLIDSPAAGTSADAQTIAVRAGTALVVVRRNSTRAWRVRGISDTVAQAKATVVGAILNEF